MSSSSKIEKYLGAEEEVLLKYYSNKQRVVVMSSWKSLLLRIGEKCPEYGGNADFKDHIVSFLSFSSFFSLN